MLIHPISPLYDSYSKILILGSFPSVKSREEGFFYGHPQNRFWRVIARVCNEPLPNGIEEKTSLLKRNNIALWDVIRSCEINGSADSSIKNAQPNDLTEILEAADIKRIFLNGKTAQKLYERYLKDTVKVGYSVLPSTSPANASWSEERLFEEWNAKISEYIRK